MSPGERVAKAFVNGFSDETRRNVLDLIARMAVFGVGAAGPSNVGEDGGVMVIVFRDCGSGSISAGSSSSSVAAISVSKVRNDIPTKRCITCWRRALVCM